MFIDCFRICISFWVLMKKKRFGDSSLLCVFVCVYRQIASVFMCVCAKGEINCETASKSLSKHEAHVRMRSLLQCEIACPVTRLSVVVLFV